MEPEQPNLPTSEKMTCTISYYFKRSQICLGLGAHIKRFFLYAKIGALDQYTHQFGASDKYVSDS